jgi:peptide/nickel transport system permease protein
VNLALPQWHVSPTLRRGAILAGIWLLLVAGADILAPYDPTIRSVKEVFLPPSWAHWFGTDAEGRDVFSRAIFASRLDLALAVLGVFPPFAIGTILGLLAAHGGEFGEAILKFLARAVGTFPAYLLAIPIVGLVGQGLRGFLVAVALTGWVNYAITVEAETRRLNESDFVVAGRGLGFGRFRILVLHILPNSLLPALLLAVSDMSGMLLLGCTLGFFGFIAPAGDVEWGAMIAQGAANLDGAWWLAFFPGLVVLAMATGFNLLSQGLAERFGSEA